MRGKCNRDFLGPRISRHGTILDRRDNHSETDGSGLDRNCHQSILAGSLTSIFCFIETLVATRLALSGMHPPSEFLVRLPSMLMAGLAGGFFASAAWRAWGPPAGLFFIPLWSLNAIVGYYAVEARPFGLLMLALSLGIWSTTRLWIASTSEISNDNTHAALWITSLYLLSSLPLLYLLVS